MARLTNRNMQIPGGLRFYQPETKFKSRPGSFNNLVDQVIAMRRANPALAQSKGWAMDYEGVANEVDAYNAAICERMGWLNYITHPVAAPAAPKFKALSPIAEKQLNAVAGKVKKVWQGVKSINGWMESGEPAVEQARAESRAATCVKCPMNGKGGLEEWFTKPAAAAIKSQFERLAERKLFTSVDDQLNVCTACLCPLKLKVHTPLQYISANMGEETRRALDPGCWILAEEREPKVSTTVDTTKP
jgi:hypothetical protein